VIVGIVVLALSDLLKGLAALVALSLIGGLIRNWQGETPDTPRSSAMRALPALVVVFGFLYLLFLGFKALVYWIWG